MVRSKLPDINRNTLTKWIKKWTGETMRTGSPCNPARPAIHEYFLSLPPDMDLKEKRAHILESFGDVAHRQLINRWTSRWQSELDPF